MLEKHECLSLISSRALTKVIHLKKRIFKDSSPPKTFREYLIKSNFKVNQYFEVIRNFYKNFSLTYYINSSLTLLNGKKGLILKNLSDLFIPPKMTLKSRFFVDSSLKKASFPVLPLHSNFSMNCFTKTLDTLKNLLNRPFILISQLTKKTSLISKTKK